MNQFDYRQMVEGNVDDTNPEDLLADGQQASMVLAGEQQASPEFKLAAMNLGRVLIELDPIALASLVSKYADEGGVPASVSNTMVQVLENKIREAAPDQLNVLIAEAKATHVWPLVKPTVLKRNDEIAAKVRCYTNLAALAKHLPIIATSESWLPGPVYQATASVLSSLAKVATVTQLDAIVEVAKTWRLMREVLPAVKLRNSSLIEDIQQYKAITGYVMQRGSQKILVDNPLRALRMSESGYEFIKQ